MVAVGDGLGVDADPEAAADGVGDDPLVAEPQPAQTQMQSKRTAPSR